MYLFQCFLKDLQNEFKKNEPLRGSKIDKKTSKMNKKRTASRFENQLKNPPKSIKKREILKILVILKEFPKFRKSIKKNGKLCLFLLENH